MSLIIKIRIIRLAYCHI